MSFYGGRPGKSFSFDRVFTSTAAMIEEANKNIGEEGFFLYPNAFALIANEEDENNGKVYIKLLDETTSKYKYSYLTNVAGIIPTIENGYWYFGDQNTNERAVAQNIEFRVLQDIDTSVYSLLLKENEDGSILYGIANLDERYSYNEELGAYVRTEDGDYIQVFASDKSGDFIFDEITGEKKLFDSENEYLLQSGFQGVYIGEEYKYLTADFLQWKYIDEDESKWRNILDVSKLNNIVDYTNIAARAASLAESAQKDINKVAESIGTTSEEMEKARQEVAKNAETVAANIEEVNEILAEINTKIDEGIVLDTEQELTNAREGFQTLASRLNHVPYEFDLYYDMLGCQYLSAGDRCLVFGFDAVGDTDSKLYGIFSPDDPLLNEIIEGSVTDENPEGEKVIAEQEKLNNSDLIAGLLTVFSGKGSGGGGGTTLLPTIKIDANNLIVQSGKTATLGYTISNPVGGNITLFIKDSYNESVIDINSKKDYSKGVVIPGNASPNGTIIWQPKRNGIHTLTFYFIVARDGSFSNEEIATVTVGGIVLTGPADGQLFNSNQKINLKYNFTSIFTDITDAIVLKYSFYKGNELLLNAELEKTATSAGDFIIDIKQASQDIGYGAFKVIATAYLKSDPSIISSTVTTNFTISKPNVITLISTYNGEDPIYADIAYSYPLIINYAGAHSTIYIKAKASRTADFAEIVDLGTQESLGTGSSIKFNYALSLPSAGIWYIRFTASGLNITATTEVPLEVIVDVQEKIDEFPLVAGSLKLDFDANLGQTNSANKYAWINRADDTIKCTLYNYNYSSNGWDYIKENGIEKQTGYLYSTGSAYAAINHSPLTTYLDSNGFTLECVFKAEPKIGKDTPILHYLANTDNEKIGIFIYQDRAAINLFGQELKTEFATTGLAMENNAIHVAFVVDKRDNLGNDPIIKIFINGVLSAASKFDNTAVLSYRNTNIYLNRNTFTGATGISKISAVRLYERPLEDTEVLINYIHNLRDVDRTQQEVADKNNLIKDGNGNLIESEASNVPRMDFYLTREKWESMTKDDKQKGVRITFTDPNLGENQDWSDCTVSWQGTSSIAYPIKNFKIKLSEKYILKTKDAEGNIIEKTQPDKTFCLKADYMDSSHYHNTGNANLINDSGYLTYASLTPAQADELGISVYEGYSGLNRIENAPSPDTLKTRTTIYGYPIVLYVHLDDEPVKFAGIYNFNLDKGSNKSFGLYRENENNSARFQDCTSFEIAANKTYSAGGFRRLKFIYNAATQEYGWTSPSVRYNANQEVSLTDGIYYYITIANQDGSESIKKTTETTIYNEVEYHPMTYIDKVNNKTYEGVYDSTKKYSILNGMYIEDENGTYRELLKYDKATYQLILIENIDGTTSFESVAFVNLADTNATIVNEVSLGSSQYSLISDWEIIDLPTNLTYYYNYYAESFELRFPDVDIYKHRTKEYNKLYYKEFDKIIALVDWVDEYGINYEYDPNTQKYIPTVPDEFINDFKLHFDKQTLLRYYIYVLAVGLIDNFGKNLMIDTWGYDSKGNIPYLTTIINGIEYRKVWKYLTAWDEDAEEYYGEEIFEYGLMNPLTGEIFASTEDYSTIGDLLETVDPSSLYGGSAIVDDRSTGWVYEIDYNKIIWYTHFYDLDSCLGSDNIGRRLYETSIEMQDTDYVNVQTGEIIKGTPFNTAESSLWAKIAIGFASDINQLQKSNIDEGGVQNILTSEVFKKYYYQNIVQVMGERWFNQDAYPKYISNESIKVIVNNTTTTRRPDEYIHLAFGNDWFRTNRWLTDRLYYLSTELDKNLYQSSANMMEMRLSDTSFYKIELELYRPCYMRAVYTNGVGDTVRVKDYNETKVSFYTRVRNESGDQEVYLVPADNIKRYKIVKEGSYVGQTVKSCVIGNATELLDLDFSSSGAGLQTLTGIESATKLNSINLTGCSSLSVTIAEKSFPYLESIKLHNSNASFTFNPTGSILKEAYLNNLSISNLAIEQHYELQTLNIELQYSNILPDGSFDGIGVDSNQHYQLLASGHNSRINIIEIENCPNLLNISITPYYRDNTSGTYITNSSIQNTFSKFINNFGVFALFQSIFKLVLSNTFSGITNQDILISLKNIDLIDITNCNINKITFISQNWGTDNAPVYSAYPGTGGSPADSDNIYANLQYNQREGLHCDSNIKTLEFRPKYNADGSTLTLAGSSFAFPWRTYLGSLSGLESIKVNVASITQKDISSSSLISDEDKNFIKASNRFELILPDAKTTIIPSLKKILVNKETKGFNFTSIRQPSDEIFTLNQGTVLSDNNRYLNENYSSKNLLRMFNHNGHSYWTFAGIDLSGYQNIQINFKGFSQIQGILGMNSIDINTMLEDPYVLENYFDGCSKLNGFYKDEGKYAADEWAFEETAWHEKAHSFKEMFNGCSSLTERFIKGYLNCSNNAHNNLKDATRMFNNCTSLNKIELDWNICTSLGGLKTDGFNGGINELFKNCSGLTSATIKIKSATSLKELKQVFENCIKLNNVQINLMGYEGNLPVSYISHIEDFQNLFANCSSLTSFNMKDQGKMDYQTGSSTIPNQWQFNSLINATNMFLNCTNLSNITFPDEINLTKATSLESMFSGCKSLSEVFTFSPINLFNETISTTSLSLANMFNRCSVLKNIGYLTVADMTRVININSMFNGCTSLTELELSNWEFADNTILSLGSVFSNCSSLNNLILPEMKVNSLNSTFYGCASLEALDLTNLIPVNLSSAASTFANCSKLSNLTGYKTWNMEQVSSVQNIFQGCLVLQNLDLSQWKLLKQGILCSGMFSNCRALTTIAGLNELFGTKENVYNAVEGLYNPGIANTADSMFYNCYNLDLENSLNNGSCLSNWGRAFKTVSSMASFFEGCHLITSINKVVSNNNETNSVYLGMTPIPLINLSRMFYGCTGLSGLTIQELVPATNEHTWLLNIPDSHLGFSSLSQMVANCNKLTTFNFNIGGPGCLSTLNSNGLREIFNDCVALTSISFLRNAELKNSIDISDTAISSNIEALLNSSSFYEGLYDFGNTGSADENYGYIWINNTQDSYLPDDNSTETEKKGWQVTIQ